MEWLLLYPAMGLFWFPWFYRNEKRYHKREDRFNGIQTLLALVILWPLALWFSPQDWKKGAQELEAEREREFQELEERVRREARARVKQEFEDFDKELRSDEPEPPNPYDALFNKQWAVTHPEAAKEYALNLLGAARLNDDVVCRVRSLPNYSKGGRV